MVGGTSEKMLRNPKAKIINVPIVTHVVVCFCRELTESEYRNVAEILSQRLPQKHLGANLRYELEQYSYPDALQELVRQLSPRRHSSP